MTLGSSKIPTDPTSVNGVTPDTTYVVIIILTVRKQSYSLS